jgi:arylsulfatase A-like enzyme
MLPRARSLSSMLRSAFVVALTLTAASCADDAQAPRDRVLIMVIDGLRPDYVTAEIMPRLNALAEGGFRGMAHHAVFPTVTRVNGPSIFTGTNPGGHGLLGNSVYLPDVEPSRTLDASVAADLRIIERATNGVLLTVPSLGEMLTERGLVYFAVSSGSSGSGLLMNHTGAGAGLVHYEFTLPDSLRGVVTELLGAEPTLPPGSSAVPRVARAVDELLLIGVDRADADVLSIWLTEPDGTAHRTGVGSPETIEALGGVDTEIGRLLDGLAERGLLERTNILVTSDHGFTTHAGGGSLEDLLVEAGLKDSGESTDVVVAGDAIHVNEGSAAEKSARIDAIVRLLQRTDWIGPVFTRGATADTVFGTRAGTVSFAAIGWDHERSGDVLTSPNWSDDENESGFRGAVQTGGTAGHGSSSPWDIHATFIAAGPGIKRGVSSSVPTGNVDITPTALALLGAPIPPDLDGRVLEELLLSGPQPEAMALSSAPLTTSARAGDVAYQLDVYRTMVGSSVYFDGTQVTRTPAR